MDSLDDSPKKSFFKYVFNFDNDSKSEMMNIIQYALIAIIPIVIFNKIMQKYVPEADENKASLEILAEIVIQVISIFIVLYFIVKIITFIPTYSGEKYPEHSVIFSILSVLLITLSLQTKLGEKVNILFERVVELWEGKQETSAKNKKGGKTGVKVSQPISQNGNQQIISSVPPTNYSGSTSINQLPSNQIPNPQQYALSPESLPNYNNMYQRDTTPLVGAATPGMSEGFSEPMAANDALGGGFGGFGSW